MNSNMEAGRELDAMVAEKVMGWKLADRRAMGWGDGPPVWITGDEPNPSHQDFRPSEDIADAWRVVEKVNTTPESRDRFWIGLADQWRKWCDDDGLTMEESMLSNVGRWLLFHADAPHAICLAALRTVQP